MFQDKFGFAHLSSFLDRNNFNFLVRKMELTDLNTLNETPITSPRQNVGIDVHPMPKHASCDFPTTTVDPEP